MGVRGFQARMQGLQGFRGFLVCGSGLQILLELGGPGFWGPSGHFFWRDSQEDPLQDREV